MAGTKKKTTPHDLDRLESLVREELEILGQVDALSQRQGSLVTLDDAGPLLALLDERQVLIERATAIAGEVATLRDEVASASGIPASRWKAVQRECNAVADLAERISRRDRDDASAMSRRRDMAATEMSQLGKGKDAAAAYGPRPTGQEPKYQDRHG